MEHQNFRPLFICGSSDLSFEGKVPNAKSIYAFPEALKKTEFIVDFFAALSGWSR
ncbi:MAG: hypothetical protein AAF669_05180 [Pseudomonadota bacterium]